MKVGQLRELLRDVPDEADIDFADGNFTGKGDDLHALDIDISEDKLELLIRPPFWTAVD